MSLPALTVRPARRTRWVLGIIVAGLLVALLVWYVNNPSDLPRSDRTINASGTTDRPVYVGVFAADSDFDRSLELSEVTVDATSNADVEVVPLLCRDGSLSVTTEPTAFCDELVDPEGQTFEDGDAIVLEVSSDETATVEIDRVEIGFREGLQWGTREAGAPVSVQITGR